MKNSKPKPFLTKPFDPAKSLGQRWGTWKGPVTGNGLSGDEDVDSRSFELTEVNPEDFIFKPCPMEGGEFMRGEKYLQSLKENGSFIRYGGNVYRGLWEDYQARGENSTLEWFYQNHGVTYMDFMGQIIRSWDGRRLAPYLFRGDNEWFWYYGWLGPAWVVNGVSAGCAV